MTRALSLDEALNPKRLKALSDEKVRIILEKRKMQGREASRRYRAKKKALKEGREPEIPRDKGWPKYLPLKKIRELVLWKGGEYKPYVIIHEQMNMDAGEGADFRTYRIKTHELLRAMQMDPLMYRLRVRKARVHHWVDVTPTPIPKSSKRHVWWGSKGDTQCQNKKDQG